MWEKYMGIRTGELSSKKRISGEVKLTKPTSSAWDKDSMTMMMMKTIHLSNILTARILCTCNAFLRTLEMLVMSVFTTNADRCRMKYLSLKKWLLYLNAMGRLSRYWHSLSSWCSVYFYFYIYIFWVNWNVT